MNKRLMTLSDLYNYYSTQGKTQTFSCTEDNSAIVVQVDGNLKFSKEKSLDGLYPTRVQMNFVGDNLNQSRIEMKAQEAALPSSHYRPLLAMIHYVDGEPQFYGHNMHQDENGEIVYDEQPVGVIAEEAHIEHDDEYDMDYAVALGYIWEEYSKASYIIERDQKCDVSVELAIRSLSYDAKDGVLVLDDFYYSGCSILGYDEDGNKVKPAMPGSNITLADFSKKTETDNVICNDKLIEAIEKLNNTISKLTIDNSTGKEDNKLQNELENMEVTEEEVEVIEEETSEEVTETAAEEEVTEVEETAETEETPLVETNNAEFTVTVNGATKTFSVSLNDKLNAMYNLIAETYSEQDNEWYDVAMYDDEKYVEMYGYFSGKNYRQSYKVKKDVYSLVGDRCEIFARYMSQDEINAFEKMKADFSEMTTKFEETKSRLDKFESEPSKMEILNSSDYAQVSDTEEFKNFMLQENHFDMSIEDVKAKADEMLLEFAKKGNIKFSVDNGASKHLPSLNKKTGRYGNLFSK